jgi:hypothetical protein
VTDWQRDIADALATIEELTRERDEAKEAELWVRGQLRLIAESDAVRIEELTRERDEARATIERMKPVVDMAVYRWRYCRRRRSFETDTMLNYVEATERATGVRP